MVAVKSADKGAVEGNAALRDHGALGPGWMPDHFWVTLSPGEDLGGHVQP